MVSPEYILFSNMRYLLCMEATRQTDRAVMRLVVVVAVGAFVAGALVGAWLVE